MTDDRRDDDESGPSLKIPAQPDVEGAFPRRGLPSFFPADDDDGTTADLDALLPSLRPDAGGASDGPIDPSRTDDISQVVAMLEPTVEPEGSGEIVIPGFEATRPSQRAGLLSSMLKQEAEEPDEGAATALRNIARRSRGRGRAPWPAVGPECDRARTTLLAHLAERSTGSLRARLSCAAAEIEGRRGDSERAALLHEHARAADPHDVVPLRALQRACVASGAWARLADLLHQETQLALTAEERALVWTRIAAIEIARGNLDAAERAASEASTLHADASVPRIVLAGLYARSGRHHEAAVALRRVADAWPAARGRAVLLIEVARLHALAGEARPALDAAEAALAAEPAALDAHLCAYRIQRAQGEVEAAQRTLERMLRIVDDPRLQAELTRTCARLAHDVGGDAQRALALLDGAGSLPALRQRARAAEAIGDHDARERALAAWADAARGTERAIASLELAWLHTARGDAARAEQALDEASAADAAFGLIRIARENLARRSGDPDRLARAFGSDAAPEALGAAARIAGTPGQEARERSLLDAARSANAGPTADVVGVDVAANQAAWAEVAAGLARAAERLQGPMRAGALLALADFARRSRVDGFDPAALVAAACAAVPDAGPVLVRRLALATTDAERAEIWLARARLTSGAAAASAAMLAHVYARRAGSDASPALARALEASPRHLPALWASERAAYATNDEPTLRQCLRLIADRSVDPVERAARRVRLALALRADDRAAAQALLDEAALERPADASISALGIDLGDAEPAAYAEHLDHAAAGAEPALARALQIEAASRHEDAEDVGRASALYLGALDTSGGTDAHARLGLGRTLPRTGLDALVVQRLEAELQAASDDDARAVCLERLAQQRATSAHADKAIDAWRELLALRPAHRGALRALERHAMEVDDQPALLAALGKALQLLSTRADRRAYLTLAWHLMREADPAARDALITDADLREPDLWLALRAEAGGRRANDAARVARALHAISTHLSDRHEQASFALRAAEAIEESAPGDATTWLREVADAPHPLVGEELGRLLQDAEPAQAASAYAAAARHSHAHERKARLLHRAACLWQDRVGDAPQALGALREVLALEPEHADAFARARHLLEVANDSEGLARLFEERLAHPMDPEAALALETERAAISAQVGDQVRARAAIAHALSLAPDRLDLLERLAGLHIQAGEHSEAAELLVRLARTAQDPELLRRTFFTLGTLYDEHVLDPRRAEIAFTRVATLAPDDPSALQRLARVLYKKGDFQKALRVLTHLYDVARDDVAVGGDCAVRIAEALEALGESVEAERTLENHRRAHPTSAVVIDALTALYTRQNAAGALVIHLDRTALSLREVIERDPAAPEPWRILIDVLQRRGRSEAARAVAALAGAFGVLPEGDAPPRAGLGPDALQPQTLRRILPAGLDTAARSLLRALEGVGELVLPSAPRTVAAAPIEAPGPALADALTRAQASLGVRPRVHETEGSQCFPISNEPLVIAIGKGLLDHADAGELAFMLIRAAALGRHDLAIAARADATQVRDALRALVDVLEGNRERDMDAATTLEFERPPEIEVPTLLIEGDGDTSGGALREVMDSIAPPEPVQALATERVAVGEAESAESAERAGSTQDVAAAENVEDDDTPQLIVEDEPVEPVADAAADVSVAQASDASAASDAVGANNTNDASDASLPAGATAPDAAMGPADAAATDEARAPLPEPAAPIPAALAPAPDASAPEDVLVEASDIEFDDDAPTIPPKAGPPPAPRRASRAPATAYNIFAGALGAAARVALLESVRELRASGFDPASVGDLAREAGSRVGLAATGDCATALTALFFSADPTGASGDPLDAARRIPEARALLAFALSDAYLTLVLRGEGSRA